ncbi:TPA: hypothetical protein ACH3X3_000974 [Trebouxia sp. C0006]
MSKQTVLMREEEIDSLSYPALQRKCKELGLPAGGKASVLRDNLKQLLVEQQDVDSPASSPKGAAGDVVPGNKATRQSLSTAQSSHSSGDHTHATLSHTHQLSKLDEDQNGPATDTAASAEKQPDVKQRKLVKSSALDAAKATPIPAQRPTSSEQLVPPEDVDDASNKMSPTSLFSESEPEYTQEQEQPGTASKADRHWLRKQWPWLLCLLLLSGLCWHVMQSRGQADMSHVGPRCNQQMHFEALEPLLAHSDARTHVAELWSGEAADPQKADGVLLACNDKNTSSAAAMAVATSLGPSCGHCLHHFDMPSLAAANSPAQGAELAGHAQKALVMLLQQCSHAVVIVEGIESTPPALLPVFINALSELGHFEDSGKQVPAYKALIIATVVMPTHSLQQGSEEDVAHAVKQHLVKSLVSHGASDAVTNQASALRRRFEHVALVQ